MLAHIHKSQHNQTFFDHFQTYTAIWYGNSELPSEEKLKIELEEKKLIHQKVHFITENEGLWVFLAEKRNF